MNHRPAPSQPRPPGRGTPRTRRMITALSGLAVFLAAAIGLAPAASAVLPPPAPSAPVPPPPPVTAAPAHFPLWAVVAIVAATIVLSVATTLITLALEHMHWARHTSAAVPEPPAGAPSPVTTPEPEDGQAEILSSHHYTAGPGVYRGGSR